MWEKKSHKPHLKRIIISRYELNSKYVLETDNNNLVVSVADAKDYLRITNDNSEDVLIQALIKSATLLIEKYTGRELLNKTFIMYLDFFPYSRRYGNRIEENFNNYTILVKRSLLQSITSIKYYINEVLTTLDSSLYSFTEDNQYSRIYLIDDGSTWVDSDNRKQAVEIEFVAGYGADKTYVPEDFKLKIKRLVAYMYENRGDCISLGSSKSGTNLEAIIPGISQDCILEI